MPMQQKKFSAKEDEMTLLRSTLRRTLVMIVICRKSDNLAASQLNSFILKLAANPESWLGECDLISFITFAVATECISKNIYGQRSTSHRRRRRSRWEDLVRRIACTQQEQRLQNVYINNSSTSFSHFPSDRLAGASNN